MELTLNEYQKRAMTTCMDTSANPLYMLFMLGEEVGELQGKFSKAIRKGWIVFEQNQLIVKRSKVDDKEFREWIELVKKELQFFIDAQVPQVKFVDRTFNCKHSHAMEIWKYLMENDKGITNFHFDRRGIYGKISIYRSLKETESKCLLRYKVICRLRKSWKMKIYS